jgi:hypothetical protein
MALTVEMVLQDDAHFTSATNCYFQATVPCCMTGDRYRFLRWEGRRAVVTDLDLDQSHTRLFSSTNQGVTWSLLTEFDVPITTEWVALFSPGGNRLLAGLSDKTTAAYDANFSFLPRSEDGGLTWVSSVTMGFYNAFTGTCRTVGFVKLPGTTTVLAFGVYDQSSGGGIGTPGWFNFLRSTDDGVTWTTFATADEGIIEDCVALSATVLVASATTAGYVSTDGGATWSPASGEQVLGAPESLGGGVVLANGRFSSLSVVWKSVDSGQTYTNHAALPGGAGNRGKTLRKVTPTILIAGTNTTPGDLQRWWLSEDGGDTWTTATIVGSQVAASTGIAMTITSQGFMLAGIAYGTTGGPLSKGELWRGTVSGFVSTGIGTCEFLLGVPAPGTALMGVHLDCVAIFSPGPCPQECPVDPLQPVGVVVAPPSFAGMGGGFAAPLFLLGFAQLEGLIAPTVSMSLPAGCGATFANNLCAVAGC